MGILEYALRSTIGNVIIVVVGLWLVYTIAQVKKGARIKTDASLAGVLDPTAHMEKFSEDHPGCLGDIVGTIAWLLLLGFLFFVVFYVLPEIGPAVGFLRDLK